MTTPATTPEYHTGDMVKFKTECGKGIVMVVQNGQASLMIWDYGSPVSSEFEVVKNECGEIGFKCTSKISGFSVIINKHPMNSKSYFDCKKLCKGFTAGELEELVFNSGSFMPQKNHNKRHPCNDLDVGEFYRIVIEQQTILL